MTTDELLDRARHRIAARDLHQQAINLSWDESLHPRGHGGKWIDKLGQLLKEIDHGSIEASAKSAHEAARRGDHHTARIKLHRAAQTASAYNHPSAPKLHALLREAGGKPTSKHEVLGHAVSSGKTRAVGVRQHKTGWAGRFAKTTKEMKRK